MPRSLAIVALLLVSACSHKVRVTLPAAPAVDLDATRVAVVASERPCRPVANALVQQFNDLPGFRVDPHATVRLRVIDCHEVYEPRVDINVGPDTAWRGRITVLGRGHAVVAVEAEGQVQAHLIGTDQHMVNAELRGGNGVALHNRVSRALTEGVAADLTDQIRPIPRMVERRVYPNATAGSARHQLNLAVRAEMAGDLYEARRRARLANLIHSSPESEAYVTELEHLLHSLVEDPPPAPH